MTKIYRIPTGQVEGNSSNETNTSEIRPYGEIGLFIGDNNKLELLMFDGVRTHRRSKILNKGTFYGGDADSSDGAGLDTIKLIPDANQHFNDGSYGNDQYLIVEPTGGSPGHVHIRAGGTIDNSGADLFLGGEKNHVKVSDTLDNVVISTDDNNSGTKQWTFAGNGTLTFPATEDGQLFLSGSEIAGVGNNSVALSSNTSVVINTYDPNPHSWNFGNDGTITFPNNALVDSADSNIEFRGMNNFNVEAGGVVNIVTDSSDDAYSWQFGDDGNLTLPGGMKINSGDYGGSPRLVIDASTGGDGYLQLDAAAAVLVGANSLCNVVIGNISASNSMTEILSPKVKFLEQTVPESSAGAPGDQPGLVAFDGSYIYYCTGTYGGTTYNVVHAIAEGTSTNGVDQGYLVADTYQLPQVGWKVYYDGEVRTINQVNSSGIPGFYVIFIDSALVIPGQAPFAWGPVSVTDIWKRVAWSGDTW